jgi:hypothetical protein
MGFLDVRCALVMDVVVLVILRVLPRDCCPSRCCFTGLFFVEDAVDLGALKVDSLSPSSLDSVALLAEVVDADRGRLRRATRLALLTRRFLR